MTTNNSPLINKLQLFCFSEMADQTPNENQNSEFCKLKVIYNLKNLLLLAFFYAYIVGLGS